MPFAPRIKPHVVCFLVAASLCSGSVLAQVKVEQPWVRGTVAGQGATGAFMTLTAGSDTRLVDVSTPAAPVAEIHEMALVDGVMRMRRVEGLRLPAGKPVALEPGGYHVMLMKLPGPLEAGKQVPLTLTFERADGTRETVEIQASVQPLASHGPGHMGAHGMQHGHGTMPAHAPKTR